jgi:hypothetical protein
LDSGEWSPMGLPFDGESPNPWKSGFHGCPGQQNRIINDQNEIINNVEVVMKE